MDFGVPLIKILLFGPLFYLKIIKIDLLGVSNQRLLGHVITVIQAHWANRLKFCYLIKAMQIAANECAKHFLPRFF